MKVMPRRSIAEKILKEVEISDDKGKYIIVYDFPLRYGEKISIKFYKNLHRILLHDKNSINIQKSVIMVSSLKISKAIAKLIKHYGGKVQIFRVHEEII